MRSLTFVLLAAGCGLDIVGTATSDEPAASSPEASTLDVVTSPTDVVLPDESSTALADAGDGCGACPSGTARTLCVANQCQATRRVFVTHAGFRGDLGGQAGADAKCTSAAEAAGLGGTWLAWVTVSGSNAPQDRFAKAAVPYRLLDGTQIVATGAQLLPATDVSRLDHDIDRDENGQPMEQSIPTEVWTGTTEYGFGSGADCRDWTPADGGDLATIGLLVDSGGPWTNAYLQSCDRTGLHLYCFEQ